MFKQSVGVALVVFSVLGCGDGGAAAGSASAAAKPAGSGSAKPASTTSATPSATATSSASAPAPMGDITLEEWLKSKEAAMKAISDNSGDCKKMVEALKAVLPDDAKARAYAEWEKKQKTDPELKKAFEPAADKAMEPHVKAFMAAVEKCGEDPEVKPLLEQVNDGPIKDEKK